MNRSTRLMIAVAISVASLWPAGTFAQTVTTTHLVPIMTRNMDEGTGFIYLFAATSVPDFLDAVTRTYQEVQASDAWALAHPDDPGFTWALHGEDPIPGVPPPTLSERIDLVLIRNHISVAGVQRIDFQNPAPSGLWPSDHAGVTAQLLVDV